MSDLDKLMQNLKKNKDEAEVKETPQETEELKETPKELISQDDQDEFDDDGYDQDEFDDEEEIPAKNNKVNPKKADPQVKAPAQNDDEDQNPIEHEVALLQNEGIFRRELLLALKELVDVQKVNAQVMIDIKKAVTGEKNAK